MSTRNPKVLICGGGIAGTAVALALSKHKITSIIFEVRPKSIPVEGGFVALAPNALRMLKSIGVYDQVASEGYNYEDMNFSSARNMSTIGRVKNGSEEFFGFKACRVRRHTVRQILLAEAEKRGIEIRYGTKCIGITESVFSPGSQTGSISLKFSDGTTEQGDLVIGTDGIHSQIRKHLDPHGAHEPIFSGQMGIGGMFQRADILPKVGASDMYLPCLILGRDNSFAMMPCNPTGSSVGFFATIEETDRSRQDWNKMITDHEYLHEAFVERHHDPASWPPVVLEVCKSTPKDTLNGWPYYTVPKLPSFLSDSRRVVVIGDAAHALPPTGGQGAAMALEDAVTLAAAIKQTFDAGVTAKEWNTSGCVDTTSLAKWDAHRLERVAAVTKFTSQGGDMRKHTTGWWAQYVKEWVLWVVLWVRASGEGLKWLYGYTEEDWRA